MKKSITLLLMLISFYLSGQIKEVRRINGRHVAGAVKQDVKSVNVSNYVVYPIVSGKISATPISIPDKNNEPLKLGFVGYNRLYVASEPRISNCQLIKFDNNELIVRIFYDLKLKNNSDVYAGAWLYDSNNKAVDAGYIPKKIINKNTGNIDVTLKFNALPVKTSYIKPILMQNGKEIATDNFKAEFYWSNSVTSIAVVPDFTKIIDISNATLAKADLEVTEVKVYDTQNNNTFPYEQYCQNRNNIVFVTNIGSKESSTYILSVGYEKKKGNRYGYVEVKRFDMPSLKSGVQTYRKILLPPDADNIIAKIIYNNNGEDANKNNNMIEKRCFSK